MILCRQLQVIHIRLLTVILMLVVTFPAAVHAAEKPAVSETALDEQTEVAVQTAPPVSANSTKEKQNFSYLSSENFTTKLNNEHNRENSAGGSALSVSLGLLFILLLIFSLAWLLKKMGYSNHTGQGQLKIVAMLNLGPKEKIALIQVGKQQLLVGMTAAQINTLHVLDEPLSISDMPDSGEASFAHKMAAMLNNKTNKA